MPETTNYITPEGHRKLLDEFNRLQRIERPRVVQEVAEAAALGDRSENAEYIYGKRRLREIDRKLHFLSKRLAIVCVVDPRSQTGDRVLFGATVEVETEDGRRFTYQIVGEDEIDPAAGKISWKSPLGRALANKRPGDTAILRRPDGAEVEYEIVAVRFI